MASAPVNRVKNLFRPLSDPWYSGLLFLGLLIALPVLAVFASVLDPQPELWQHLVDTVLADYVTHSLLLAFGVGAGCLLIGTTLAWVVSRYEFVGRGALQWLVLLPMAFPAYIIAYTYTGMLDFAGPVQTALRETFDWGYGDYWFPEIRSLGGAILMMVLVLYPYVYLLARTAFSEQSQNLFEASRSMGVHGRAFFFRVAFPLARPAILTGTALAMMEAFADYGTVQYFGVSTFTTGIFRTWFGLGNAPAAAQLSALLCTFVLVLLLLEKWSRRRVKYYQRSQKPSSHQRIKLSKTNSIGLCVLVLSVPLFGFVLPFIQLASWAWAYGAGQLDQRFVSLMLNSFFLAGAGRRVGGHDCIIVLLW